jgi:nitrate/nitrite transporter NarK
MTAKSTSGPASDGTPTIRGSPRRGVASATLGFFVGFAGVVLYGPVATELEGAMGLSGLALGLLVAAPQLTGSLLRIPFGAWVKDVGAAKPFLVLLGGAVVGMAGLSTILVTLGTDGLTMAHYPLVFLFGALSGCGIATFSVGAAQTSYWSPEDRQGTMLAVYAGLGNSSPGIFTLLVPVALAVLGLTGAYLAWFGFLVCGTFVYGLIAVDPPFFQLRKQGLEAETAKQRAETRGQELFPSGDAMASILLGVGIGVANAAVFGLVPTYVPEAVGGASGLVGGLGAFGGFAIPPILGLFVDLQGPAGYATVSSSSSSSRSPRSASRASCTALEWCRRRTARFRPTIEPVRFLTHFLPGRRVWGQTHARS